MEFALLIVVLIPAGVALSQSYDEGGSEQVQPDSSVSTGATIVHDVGTLLRLSGSVLGSPARWQGSDWLLVAGTAGLTGGAMLLDDESYDLMERNHSHVNDRLQSIAVEYGGTVNVLLCSVGLYTAGLLFDHKWIRETGLLIGGSLAVSGLTMGLTKRIAGRARPYTGHGPGYYLPFTGNPDFLSFPSGHVVAAFTISAVLAERIGNPWATAGLYCAATGTGLSRMYSRSHWLSDVVFAALYSTAVARSMTKLYETSQHTEPDEDSATLLVIPSLNGITIRWRL